MSVVFVFPGQGSQFVGMASELEQKNSKALAIFNKADQILGFDLAELMRTGDASSLQQTKVTQSAVFVYSIACLELLKDKNLPVKAVAGHSLGEFTALVAAGVLSFEDALRLVDIRAKAMQKACETNPSTMAAVLGLEDQRIADICASITNEVVVAANFNCTGQVVISGTFEGIKIAQDLLKEAGAKRVLPLAVGGAFHSPLMASAEKELADAILSISFHNPNIPIYQNITAKPVTNPSEVQQNLIRQLTGAVRWTQTIEQMQKDGFSQYIEVGPGKVLQGLIGKTAPTASIQSWESFLAS